MSARSRDTRAHMHNQRGVRDSEREQERVNPAISEGSGGAASAGTRPCEEELALEEQTSGIGKDLLHRLMMMVVMMSTKTSSVLLRLQPAYRTLADW